MELTLSQKFKLSITLWAIILFIIMFISLATTDKKEIVEEKEVDLNWCISATDISARLIRDRVSTAEYQCEILEWEWCPKTDCLWLKSVEDERYPWKLTASWDSQLMPELEEKTSHDRFKELCYKYWLNPSAIWEVENKYNIREWVILGIIIAETSGGKNWYWVEWCWNYGNVWNNDRWDRYCFTSESEWLNKIWRTLSNQYLGSTQTLGCLSKAWSCTWWENKGHIYASSDWNWERTMLNVLNAIYQEELWSIEPDRFNVRRQFTIYQ